MSFTMKAYPVLVIFMGAVAIASSECPTNEMHNLGGCAFQIFCRRNISRVSLPDHCKGSTNFQVNVDLTLTKAIEKFDEENVDPEFLTAITSLVISGNWPSTNLSILQYTPRLRSLHLVGNNIKTIAGSPFFQLNHLETIDLSENRLTDVVELFQFENSPNKMRKLSLAHNDIDDIPGDAFVELTSLLELDLSYNLISDLTEEPFNNLSSLITLKLNNNKIKDLNGAVNNLQNLKHLFLSGNEIQHIDAPSLKIIYELETFDVSQNKLESLTSVIFIRHWNHFENTTICKINLARNFIVSLPNATASKQIVERFMRSPARRFHFIDVLTELDLSQNMISDIEYDAFQPVVRLSVLDLSQNKLIKFMVNTKHLEHVKYLNLSSNYIQKLYFDNLWPMRYLQNLDLSHNMLDNIPENTFIQNYNLKYVNMTFNEIRVLKSLGISIFHQTGGVLDLSNNGLHKFNLPSTEGLYINMLILTANNISDASFVNLCPQKNLKTLYMDKNLILELKEKSLRLPHTLSLLDLSYNSIQKIAPASFQRARHLITLRLGHNNITDINYGVFQGLNLLKYLDLSFNNIKYLDSKVLMDLKSLSILSLRFNGLYLIDYKGWVGHKSNVTVYLEGNSFSCEWLGTALSDFNSGDSKMSPAVNYESVSGYSISGIPCTQMDSEIGQFERLSSSPVVMADERLLKITQKILEEVREQNSFLLKILGGSQRHEVITQI